MARMGLRVAANIRRGCFGPAEAELRLAAGRRWREGVLEIPVATYR